MIRQQRYIGGYMVGKIGFWILVAILTVTSATGLASEDDPRSFAGISIRGCGKLGRLTGSGGGSGTSGPSRSASFDIICTNGNKGDVHIQLGPGNFSFVSVRKTERSNPVDIGEGTRGQARSLVRQGIRETCGCR